MEHDRDHPRPFRSRPRSPTDLGAFLRAARQQENLSQDALAQELGIDRRVLQRMESGAGTLYALRLFVLMSRLGVEMELRKG